MWGRLDNVTNLLRLASRFLVIMMSKRFHTRRSRVSELISRLLVKSVCMDKKVQESWERFLHPQALRTNLIVASLFIAAFEILKETIIERAKEFFFCGINANGIITTARYQEMVLTKNRSVLHASLQWLKEQEVVDVNDVVIFEQIKKMRNQLAHEMPHLLTDGLPEFWLNRFSELISLVGKIEHWWIVNIEIPTNPDFGPNDEIDEDGVVPGKIIILRMMIDIALGTDKESTQYYEDYMKNIQVA